METYKSRPKAGWYVVQVTSGSEDRMCRRIASACSEFDKAAERDCTRVGLKECFTPRFASRKKRMGQWHDVNRALMPGYVIVDVMSPAALAQVLESLNSFCRVLMSNETYLPLKDSERRWLEAHCGKDGRVVPMSFGHRRLDGRVVVTSGPLKGHEAMITRFDRRNCMAHVELHVGPITMKATVGLVVMPNDEDYRGE